MRVATLLNIFNSMFAVCSAHPNVFGASQIRETLYEMLLFIRRLSMKFVFVPEITIGDILTIIMIMVILVTYYFSRRSEKKLQKAIFIRDYTKQLHEKSGISSIFFDIDYKDSLLIRKYSEQKKKFI